MVKNLPNLKKETDKQIQEAEGPKQDEPKHTYAKTIKNGREGRDMGVPMADSC